MTSKDTKVDGRRLRKFPSMETRFWQKVRKTTENGCWLWTAALNEHGYGVIHKTGMKNGNELAHRYSYMLHGSIKLGELEVCHRCDNPKCVNPRHLFLGSHTDNMRDSIRKGRFKDPINGLINRSKTHCANGHEFNEENTLLITQIGS